jgi:hypothetical protein
MADLDDIDPRDVTIPPDDDDASDASDANPDAQAEADEDASDTDTTSRLADDDPNKSW